MFLYSPTSKSIVDAVYDRAYFVDLGRMNGKCHSPPEIGGVDATSRRSREASFKGAAGVVGNATFQKSAFRNTSSIPTTY